MVEQSIPLYWRTRQFRYRLMGTKCEKDGKVYFPPRKLCPECGEILNKTVLLPRTGKVVSYSVVHNGLSNREEELPYAVGLIELDDGTRVVGQIIGIPPENVSIGMRVKFAFRKYGAATNSAVIRYGYKFVPETYPNVNLS